MIIKNLNLIKNAEEVQISAVSARIFVKARWRGAVVGTEYPFPEYTAPLSTVIDASVIPPYTTELRVEDGQFTLVGDDIVTLAPNRKVLEHVGFDGTGHIGLVLTRELRRIAETADGTVVVRCDGKRLTIGGYAVSVYLPDWKGVVKVDADLFRWAVGNLEGPHATVAVSHYGLILDSTRTKAYIPAK